MSGENSAHNSLVEFQAKGQVDLLSNARTAISWIAPLHRNDYEIYCLKARLADAEQQLMIGLSQKK